MTLPGPGLPGRESFRRATLDHAGSLAGRPLGRCFVQALTDVLADFDLSDVQEEGLLVQSTVIFPGGWSEIFPAPAGCGRR